MIGKIYVIENQVNHKKYIGKTYNTIEHRWKEHIRDSCREHLCHRPLYVAMAKYGIKNFTISLLEETDCLEEREVYWINQFDTYNNGYNATIGGDGRPKYLYDDLIQDFKNGLLIKEIADKYQCDLTTVTRALHSENLDGRANRAIRLGHAVKQYSLNGELLNEFPSQKAAARFLISQNLAKGTDAGVAAHISQAIRGNRQTAYGFKWQAQL